jgi:hypothetical protein
VLRKHAGFLARTMLQQQCNRLFSFAYSCQQRGRFDSITVR